MTEFGITPVEQQQLAMLHAHLIAGGDLVAPFAKEIFLIETHVAGTSHVPIREIEPTLVVGGPLVLRRETENEHDPLAILILSEEGARSATSPATGTRSSPGSWTQGSLFSRGWRRRIGRVTGCAFRRGCFCVRCE